MLSNTVFLLLLASHYSYHPHNRWSWNKLFYKQLTGSESLMANIMIIPFIHSKVFTICVKGAPKPNLKKIILLCLPRLFHKKRSSAFPLLETHLKPPRFEQRANRRGNLKKKVWNKYFLTGKTWLGEGTLQGYNFAADQVTIQRQVNLNSPFTCSTSQHFLCYLHNCHRCGLSRN